MERYDWQLITPGNLVEQGVALVASGAAWGFTRALVGAYCVVMHRAFMGELGPEAQRRVCEELGRMFASLLARRYPLLPVDERADVTQNALERVWRTRESCREPIAFLSFASYHLLTSVQLIQRQLKRQGVPLQSPSGDEDTIIDIPDRAPSPMTEVLNKEHRAEVAQIFQELRERRSRAKGQIEVLALRWLDNLDYAEIAERLQISPATAQTRLSRILSTIRGDPELLERARELGLG